MGMSASQARLLSLTSRIHDIEFKAQNIESQKLALATQKDEVYKNYCDALDATKIQVAYWNGAGSTKYVDANFSTLCNYNEYRCKQYALKDNNSGLLIVNEEVKEKYDLYNNDKYSFAWAMMGFDGNYGWSNPDCAYDLGIGTSQHEYGIDSESGTGSSLYMTECEEIAYNEKVGEFPELETKYNAVLEAESDSDKKTALKEFREYLYKKCGTEIYNHMNYDKQFAQGSGETIDDRTWNEISSEFNYYVNLFSAIKDAGGCQVIDPQYENGDDGNAWFNNMINAGRVGILVFEDRGSEKEWSETSVATSTNENYLQETHDDTLEKKAEAEYEHELSVINRKDAKFDTELSKLETERSALAKERDSLTQVIKDNVDQSFKIFS